MTHCRRFMLMPVLAAAVVAVSAIAVPAQSSAAPGGGAAASAVTSGDARFEVLSPTLIRTEYAGDAHFVDAATFNAIGRDGFAPTRFTARTVDGWLTIQTDMMTLRYKVGSGAFGPENLSVRLRAGW